MFAHSLSRFRGLFLSLIFTASAFTAPSCLAWSSMDAILFEDVHSMAIEKVLTKLINNNEFMQTLKSQQKEVDKQENQTWQGSYMHSMTGTDGNGQTRQGNLPTFIRDAEKFIRDNLTAARNARHNGIDSNASMAALGKAIHTMEDGISPSHQPFQEWSANETWYQIALHVANERLYPQDTDPGHAEYRQRLEATVLWAYNLYTGKDGMPYHFFNDRGELNLPPQYLSR